MSRCRVLAPTGIAVFMTAVLVCYRTSNSQLDVITVPDSVVDHSVKFKTFSRLRVNKDKSVNIDSVLHDNSVKINSILDVTSVKIDSVLDNNNSVKSESVLDDHGTSVVDNSDDVLDNILSIEMVVIPFLRYKTVEKAILEREQEYKTALQRNLDHTFVSHIHVLTTDASWTRQRLSDLTNNGKLIVAEVKSIDMARDPFEYISHNLVGKNVIFASADIYLGGGFDRVDPVVLSQTKIMYALTRRTPKMDKCQTEDLCLKSKYIGCHDVFLFHLTEPLSENGFLRDLQFDMVSPGIENIVIWLFKYRLKYCVLNPCALLETFHLHCSSVRNKRGKTRVNHHRSGLAPFTNEMVCS